MVEKYQLANGMAVLLQESHKSPVVSVQMWVKTGSADEREGEEGISHFIEHLVFKGSKKYGVGEIAATVEGSGGELNAYTSFDQTVFHVTLSSQQTTTALDVISQMMGFPEFQSDEIDREREVVIEEIKRSFDSPGREMSRLLFSTVFKQHPYGKPVIGYEEIIRKVSRETILNYYQSRYVPSNMTLVVTGDFENKTIKKQIQQMFGVFKPYPLRKIKRTKDPKQSEPRIEVKKVSFEESMLSLAWRGPGALEDEAPVFDVLAMILGQGDSSRLVRRLRLEELLVNSVGSYSYTPFDEGFLAVSCGLQREKLPQVLEAIGQEILGLFIDPPSDEEIQRAVMSVEAEEYYSMETVDGLAQKIGHFQFLFGDPNAMEKYLKRIRKITASDLLKLAQKAFSPERLNLVFLTDSGEEKGQEELKQWIADYKKVFEWIESKSVPKVKTIAPVRFEIGKRKMKPAERVETQLASGLRVVLYPTDQSPTLSLRSAFMGGLRAEDPSENGVAELLAGTWATGTRLRNENQINNDVERMAARLRAFGGRNSFGVSAEMLSPFLDEGLQLFSEVITQPEFTPAIIEREKLMMLEELRLQNDNPAQKAVQAFNKMMFGSHPYARNLSGEAETVEKLDARKVENYWKKYATPANGVIVACGNFQPEKMVTLLERKFAHLSKGAKFEKKFEIRWPQKSESKYGHLDKKQSHIVMGYRGLTIHDQDRFVLQVIQAVLAGQGGRLFLNLRDKASLAYSVSPLRMEGMEGGYFGAYIGCSPEKGKQAIRMMKEEFEILTTTKISQVELDRAKKYLCGRHDIDLQRNSALASSLLFTELYGLSADEEIFRYFDQINGVTAERALQVAQKIFSQPEIVSVVGAENPL